MDVGALALAMSIGAVFNTIILAFILERRIKNLDFSVLLKPVFYLVVSSAISGVSAYGTLYFVVKYLNTHKVLHLIVQGGIAGLVGILVFIVSSIFFGIEEIKQLGSKLKFKGKIVLPSLDEEAHK
jgi:peptidoglycan biosynthesis protein MviN/MurJ (putative lipid II flippase)